MPQSEVGKKGYVSDKIEISYYFKFNDRFI
jgi:hypothetical protein